jgi:CheY-like chemotaxis protein/anti-sigma regulatory factor (Ser/Thr protein kinase)
MRRIDEVVRNPERDSNELQGAFAARLVHEIRNPLAPIRMALHIMQMSDQDAGTLQAARVIIERQLGQLTRLVDDIDEVTQPRLGALPLRMTPTTLGAVLETALDLSRSQREHRRNILELNLNSADVPLSVDTGRLAQAIANVLSNASKYSPIGSAVEVSAAIDAGHAEITVADHGIGIPTTLLGRIFDPFVRIDRAGDGIYDGLGIGLTLAKKIVEAHGGQICATNRDDGPGIRVQIRIPRLQSQGDTGRATRIYPETDRGLRILVADDNRDAAHTLAMMLDLEGHDVRTAHDGLETLAVGQLFKPELILLDIAMPVLNGYQTARQIRERPWGHNVYLVALTAWGRDSDRQAALENGFQDHIVKPASIERLRTVVNVARDVGDRATSEADGAAR